jgi:Protein of unknown function (DUF3500)
MARKKKVVCPDCEAGVDRRGFLGTAAVTAAAAAAGGIPLFATPKVHANPTPSSAAETAVKALYDSLDDKQKKEICFDWDYKDSRGLLRTHVSNNWQITKPTIDSDFYTKKQQDICFDIFKGIFNPDWHKRLLKQLKDDSGGEFGKAQSIAIFGKPGDGKFELVMTGRHLTCRADGDSEAHVAFGGPIFHGHAASGFTEEVGHPDNVFWHQALQAYKVYKLFDKDQQEKALITKRPAEAAVPFRGKDKEVKYPGLPAKEMSGDQKKELQKVLLALIEPYRKEDVEEVEACLKAQGGLEACSLAFYKEGALGDDAWDNWRLEGPTFVWYFRGTPHVHIWINVADDPSPELNAKG